MEVFFLYYLHGKYYTGFENYNIALEKDDLFMTAADVASHFSM
jgi:hypothetical protein